MRVDRLVTLQVVGPLRSASLRSGSAPHRVLPILMYHSIGAESESKASAYFRTSTSPARFAEHMSLIQQTGRYGVSVNLGLKWLQGEREFPRPPVAISFDDGFGNFLTDAFPVLKQHGFSATVYLPTSFIGSTPKSFKGRACLTWPEAAALQAEGVEFGSHTDTHPVLYDLSWDQIRQELIVSRQKLGDALGQNAFGFAYPYAFPQQDITFVLRLSVLLREFYSSCVTTQIGRCFDGCDPFCLKRIPINNDDDPALFLAKIAGAYDWLGGPQAAWKRLRGALQRAKAGTAGRR